MKIKSGKAARVARRREIIASLFSIIEVLAEMNRLPPSEDKEASVDQTVKVLRELLLELTEITAIESMPPPRARHFITK